MRALLVAILVCTGCAHPPRAPPLTGWRALRTPHLRLRTDLPPSDARTTVEQLETLRAALQTAWSEAEETPGMTEAIVLRDDAELRTFTELTGVATLTARGPLLVTAGSPTSFGDLSPDHAVLAHEMAHDLGHRWMPGAPRWFDEGLASYLESAELIDTGRVRLGAIRRVDLEYARAHPLIPLDTLVLTPWETQGPSAVRALYRSARLWVQLLRAEEGQRMRALESALRRESPGGSPGRRHVRDSIWPASRRRSGAGFAPVTSPPRSIASPCRRSPSRSSPSPPGRCMSPGPSCGRLTPSRPTRATAPAGSGRSWRPP